MLPPMWIKSCTGHNVNVAILACIHFHMDPNSRCRALVLGIISDVHVFADISKTELRKNMYSVKISIFIEVYNTMHRQ